MLIVVGAGSASQPPPKIVGFFGRNVVAQHVPSVRKKLIFQSFLGGVVVSLSPIIMKVQNHLINRKLILKIHLFSTEP